MNGQSAASRQLRYVIIGAGMAGILAGVRLKRRGVSDFIIYEKGSSVGGTWRENRYPGLTCDVPAHAYTYSFAPNPEWSSFFSPGPEIRDYFDVVVDKEEIREHLRLNTEIASCTWSDQDKQWHIVTKAGTTDRAHVVIAATGVLHHPNIPEIPGVDDFEGHIFHSARWDDAAPIDGHRVGVIGNGSTGVQIVSALSKRAKSVIHFQRSPQWIMPVENFAYSDEDRAVFRADVAKIDAIRDGEDYWGGIRRFNDAIINPESDAMKEIEAIVLRNLEDNVRDPELRERLRPDYRAACKRLIYSPDYYEAVQRPETTVETGKIARIVATGVEMVDGQVYELDSIVLATGFKADRFVRPMNICGRNGIKLDDVWKRRPSAYLAVSIPDFPNLFLLNGPTGPVGNFSLIDIAERQWHYVEQLIALVEKGEADEVSAAPEAMKDYDERRIVAARKTIFGSGCTSWYLDAEGVPASWPWSYDAFADAMKKPDLASYDVR